ncbi:metal-dependent hydrolase (plasmid) [Citricoccus nitrophenolicus]
MMGAHHAACGAAAWVALTGQAVVPTDWITEPMGWAATDPVTIGMGMMDLGPGGVAVGALVCAGAALVPDADHHNATIAHSLPPVTQWVCDIIGKASGGHRHGTHSIIGIAFFTLVAFLAGLWTVEGGPTGTIAAGAGVLSVMLVAFAAKVLRIIPDSMRKTPWVVGILGGAWVALFPPDHPWWFIIAMALGTAVHIAGDMMTTGGCNLAWPGVIKPPKAIHHVPILCREIKGANGKTVVGAIWQRNGYMGFPVLGNAGSWREWLLLVPISGFALFGMAAALMQTGQSGIDQVVALMAGS